MGPVDVERRPHWADDLISAAQNEMVRGHNGFELWNVYAVIAAVEDWHKAKRDSRDRTHSEHCWRWHQECAEQLIERQQAVIQRVQEFCRTESFAVDDRYRIGYATAQKGVLRALDGDSDE